MLLVAILAFFGNAYQYQTSFNMCRGIDYKPRQCKHHLKMVKHNYKSKYHVK